MADICHKCGTVYADHCKCSCLNCGVKLLSNEDKYCSLCISAGEHAGDLSWGLEDEEKYGQVPHYNSLEEYLEKNEPRV